MSAGQTLYRCSRVERSEELERFKRSMRELVDESGELGGFLEYVESAEKPEILSGKTKELMSLAIGVVLRCEPCLLWHTDAALDAGASEDEVVDALEIAVAMGGGPSLAYATKAYEIMKDLREEKE